MTIDDGMLPRQYTDKQAATVRTISQAEAARRLEVSKYHLNRVLRGHRESRSLKRRYRALMAQIRRAA